VNDEVAFIGPMTPLDCSRQARRHLWERISDSEVEGLRSWALTGELVGKSFNSRSCVTARIRRLWCGSRHHRF
jgi:hypothetical protein